MELDKTGPEEPPKGPEEAVGSEAARPEAQSTDARRPLTSAEQFVVRQALYESRQEGLGDSVASSILQQWGFPDLASIVRKIYG